MAAMLVYRNNKIFLPWELTAMFMQTICLNKSFFFLVTNIAANANHVPSFSSKHGHVTEKHVLIGHFTVVY